MFEARSPHRMACVAGWCAGLALILAGAAFAQQGEGPVVGEGGTARVHGPYEVDGPLEVRGLLTVHGPLAIATSITVRFGRQNISGPLTENSKLAPKPGDTATKIVNGPLTIDGPLTVHGSLTVDGLEVDGPATVGGSYQTL